MSENTEKKNILVVDDDKDVVEVISAAVSNYGYSPIAATSGPQALEVLQADQPKVDMIILDLMMPEMDGYETLNQAKQLGKIDIPVVVLTAKDSFDDLIEGFKHEIKFYITKPFKLDSIRKVIRYYLEDIPESEKMEIEDTI